MINVNKEEEGGSDWGQGPGGRVSKVGLTHMGNHSMHTQVYAIACIAQ